MIVRPRRRGMTLVDTLVMLSIASVFMSLIAVALASTFRLRDRVDRATAQMNIQARLSFDLRRDAHAASHVEMQAASILLTMDGDHKVRYTNQPDGSVARIQLQDDKTQHREEYLLKVRPEGLHWWLADDGSALALEISSDLGRQRLFASLGLDERLLQGATE